MCYNLVGQSIRPYNRKYSKSAALCALRRVRFRLVLAEWRMFTGEGVSVLWCDFYDNFCDWSDSTVKTRISSLEDIGSGDEVVDAVLNFDDEGLKDQLIRKAMKLGVELSHDNYVSLDGELSDRLYEELAKYGHFSLDETCFDPEDFSWDDFYAECANLPDNILMKCIPRIDSFGPSDEVTEAIDSIINFDIADALYTRAVQRGVKFTHGELERLGRSGDESDSLFIADDIRRFNENTTDEMIENYELAIDRVSINVDNKLENAQKPKPRNRGLLGLLVGMGTILKGGKKTKHDGRCDGD